MASMKLKLKELNVCRFPCNIVIPLIHVIVYKVTLFYRFTSKTMMNFTAFCIFQGNVRSQRSLAETGTGWITQVKML